MGSRLTSDIGPVDGDCYYSALVHACRGDGVELWLQECKLQNTFACHAMGFDFVFVCTVNHSVLVLPTTF